MEVEKLEHVLGLGVDLQDVQLEGRHVWNVIVSSLSLFLLQLDRNASNRGPLQPLHEVGDEASNLVPRGLVRDESHFFDDPLVDVEVQGQLGVVLLDDDPGGLLDSLGADAAHPGLQSSTNGKSTARLR